MNFVLFQGEEEKTKQNKNRDETNSFYSILKCTDASFFLHCIIYSRLFTVYDDIKLCKIDRHVAIL